MGKFYYFDTVLSVTWSKSETASSYASGDDTQGFACGDPQPPTFLDSTTGSFSSQHVGASLSFSAGITEDTGLTEIFDGNPFNTGDLITGSTSYTRDNITNPTYSYTHEIDGGQTADTATGGNTLITTGTTTQSFSTKETTTTIFENNTYTYGLYLQTAFTDTSPVGLYVTASNTQNTVTTTIPASTTITNILTTVTGYHFGFRIVSAQALWILEHYEGTSRYSPAFSASCPFSQASSFYATATSGIHAFISTLDTTSTSFSNGTMTGGVILICPSPPFESDSITYTTESGSTGQSGGQYLIASSTTSVNASNVTIRRTFLNSAMAVLNTGTSKLSEIGLCKEISRTPSSTYYYSPNVVGLEVATNLAVQTGFGAVSAISGQKVRSPFYFIGIKTGSMAGAKATFSWLSSNSIGYTKNTGTIITNTETTSGIIDLSSISTSSSQTLSESYVADTNFYKPPFIRITNSLFDAVESYGTTSGSYIIASTNSSGLTNSFTTDGTTSRNLVESDYLRPIKKDAITYAYTTGTSYTIDMDTLVNISYGLPVFSGYYGRYYDAKSTGSLVIPRVEEGSTFTLERTANL